MDDNPTLQSLIKKFGRDVFIENGLNKRVRDIGLGKDLKIEIALLGMRQRRRFLQCKRLELPIPNLYKRVHSIRTLPRFLQDELLKYAEVIAKDPWYRDDQELQLKDQKAVLAYILGDDQRALQQVLLEKKAPLLREAKELY